MELKNDLPKLAIKLSAVYGYPLRIRGPYFCKDGRLRVDIVGDSKGFVKTCLLARVKLEVKIKRKLKCNEEVDHKDNDKTNDAYSNVQLLLRGDNVRKRTALKPPTLGYKQPEEQKKHGEKNGKSKLTDKQAKSIRVQFSKGKLSRERTEEKTGLTDRAVRLLLNGTSYITAGGPVI